MPNSETQQLFTVRPGEAGLRLDYFLRGQNRELSQRACKRLCRNSLILVNGKPAKPGQLLHAGDAVLLNQPPQSDTASDLYSRVKIVKAQNGLYAIKKPAGLHSVSLHGSGNPSLEDCLQLRWGELWDDWTTRLAAAQTIYPFEEAGAGQGFCAFSEDPPMPELPRLLNRLDQDTSGLVMAAGTAEARQRYLSAEETWRISKNYLALVRGSLEQPLTLTNTLRSHNKTRMKARDYADMNPLRHTRVTPLSIVNLEAAVAGTAGLAPPDGLTSPESIAEDSLRQVQNSAPAPARQSKITPCTLVLARIAKGARHQIRVHLAQAGYPIVGDTLYGPVGAEKTQEPMRSDSDHTTTVEQEAESSELLFLHHAHISLPGFNASLQPDWPEYLWRQHWSQVTATADTD